MWNYPSLTLIHITLHSVGLVLQLELATSVSPPTRHHVTMNSVLSGVLLSKFSRNTLMAGGLLGMLILIINRVCVV